MKPIVIRMKVTIKGFADIEGGYITFIIDRETGLDILSMPLGEYTRDDIVGDNIYSTNFYLTLDKELGLQILKGDVGFHKAQKSWLIKSQIFTIESIEEVK